jgi:hypothetical protein
VEVDLHPVYTLQTRRIANLQHGKIAISVVREILL